MFATNNVQTQGVSPVVGIMLLAIVFVISSITGSMFLQHPSVLANILFGPIALIINVIILAVIGEILSDSDQPEETSS